MNREDYFIHHLGIGPIWKSNDKRVECHQNFTNNIALNTDSNEDLAVSIPPLDVLILRETQQVNDATSTNFVSQGSEEAEILFERILHAFQLNSKMNITVHRIGVSHIRDEFSRIIQLSPAKILAVFSVDLARNLLGAESFLIDDYCPQESISFHHLPMFVFHSPEEILKNSMLKKMTWEKMCALKSSLH